MVTSCSNQLLDCSSLNLEDDCSNLHHHKNFGRQMGLCNSGFHHNVRSLQFWDVTQHWWVVSYGHFRTNQLSQDIGD